MERSSTSSCRKRDELDVRMQRGELQRSVKSQRKLVEVELRLKTLKEEARKRVQATKGKGTLGNLEGDGSVAEREFVASVTDNAVDKMRLG